MMGSQIYIRRCCVPHTPASGKNFTSEKSIVLVQFWTSSDSFGDINGVPNIYKGVLRPAYTPPEKKFLYAKSVVDPM